MNSMNYLRLVMLVCFLTFIISWATGGYAQTVSRDDSNFGNDRYRTDDVYRGGGVSSSDANNDYYRDRPATRSYSDETYGSRGTYDGSADRNYRRSENMTPNDPYYDDQPGVPYETYRGPDDAGQGAYRQDNSGLGTFSQREIKRAGHKFFGSISEGLANAIEYVFQSSGRPNGYILGEDAGGAIIAGLRYGEGYLYTRDGGTHKVYWQGPTVGYDLGAEGSKTMVLVYNLQRPSDIFHRFGGVEGSAYVVGGVSVQLQKHEHVTLAPIRSGLGLRLGANVGYLKYTRAPTWNPF